MTDTLREIDQAVQAHIAQAFPGQLVDSWVLVTHSAGLADDEQHLHNYRLISGYAGQPWHIDAGLVNAANRIVKDAWDFDGADED